MLPNPHCIYNWHAEYYVVALLEPDLLEPHALAPAFRGSAVTGTTRYFGTQPLAYAARAAWRLHRRPPSEGHGSRMLLAYLVGTSMESGRLYRMYFDTDDLRALGHGPKKRPGKRAP